MAPSTLSSAGVFAACGSRFASSSCSVGNRKSKLCTSTGATSANVTGDRALNTARSCSASVRSCSVVTREGQPNDKERALRDPPN
ncbi:hypothetical protein [Actinoplanes sp. NPDC049599]|uniref:hypothetical protein n=1 Tax=Actinoplanes sp. NPDC049599 TaxID=3363903 RepID=UPI0037AE502C